MKKIKWLFLITISYFFLGMSDGCDDKYYEEIYGSYTNISTTKAEIKLNYKVLDQNKVSKAYVVLTRETVNGETVYINSMAHAKLTINGEDVLYGEIDGLRCFYPSDPHFKLIPGEECHVTISDSLGTYDSRTVTPPEFSTVIIPDTMDISKGINLSWTNPYPTYKVRVFVEVYNPTDKHERITLVNKYLSQFDNITVANSLSPFIDGWYGVIELEREHNGICSLAMHEESTMTAYSSYKKIFVIRKEK